MENSKLLINARRNGYSPEQCGKTLTVGELIDVLSFFDDDLPVYLSHDNGYTYGSIIDNDFIEDNTLEED